ncbi:Cdc7p-Dbf4p kinase complex regulatory subunit [Chamberlinius hualienensis]
MIASKNGVVQSNTMKRNSDVKDYMPLRGCNIYLDINNNLVSQKITEQIREFGGTVETFLNKNVKYLVTNRPNWKLNIKGSSCENSLMCTPSSLNSASLSSTTTADSPWLMESAACRIVQKAVMKYSEDVLQTATKYNIKIIHLSQLIDTITKFKSKVKPVTRSNRLAGKEISRLKLTTINMSRTKLVSPYMKYEDVESRYCPQYRQLQEWPVLNLTSNHRQSPFRKVNSFKTYQNVDNTKGTNHVLTPRIENSTTVKKSKGASSSKRNQFHSLGNKPGYCEICSTRYVNIYDHVVTDRHQKFINEPHFFAKLDKFLSVLPSLTQIKEKFSSNSENSLSKGSPLKRNSEIASCTMGSFNSPSTANKSRSFRLNESFVARKRLKLDAEPCSHNIDAVLLPYQECKENMSVPTTEVNSLMVTPKRRRMPLQPNSFALQNDSICNVENVNNDCHLPNACCDALTPCRLKATSHRLLRSTSQRRSVSSNAAGEPESSSPLVATREQDVISATYNGEGEEERLTESMVWKQLTPLNLSTKLSLADLVDQDESVCHECNASKQLDADTSSVDMNQCNRDNDIDDSALPHDVASLLVNEDLDWDMAVDSFIERQISPLKSDNKPFKNV